MVANFCFVAKKWSRNPRIHIFGRKKSKFTRSSLKKRAPSLSKNEVLDEKTKSPYGEFGICVPNPKLHQILKHIRPLFFTESFGIIHSYTILHYIPYHDFQGI